jgi:predicted O-methyltransferase YrrM
VHLADPMPELCSRIRAAFDAQRRPSGLTPEFGGMLRVLAASKSAGHILCFGDDAGEAGAWILDGMDFTSGLVVLVQRPEDQALLGPEFDRDVRASLHRQDVEPFLMDVRSHRFNLIVDRIAGEHPEILRRALGMLRPGGLCVVADSGESVARALAERAAPAPAGQPAPRVAPLPVIHAREFSVATLGGAADVRLVVRRPARPQRRQRAR